jgi:DNA-binding NtrC family response regulator
MARILIVEDAEELADELRTAVGPDHEITVLTNSGEAIRFIDANPIDLLVTALVLETGDFEDGLRVVSAARRSHPAPQAIIITSYGTPETCVQAIGAGAFDYIERNSPGIDFVQFLRWKVSLALAGQP